jgi:hypothetical protein
MNHKASYLRYPIVLLLGIILLFSNTVLGQSPSIVVPPESQGVPKGGTAYLSVTVAGALPITYTWHRNFESTNYYQATLDSTNCTLTLPDMMPSNACFFNLDTHNSFGNGPGKQVVVAVISSGMATNGFVLTIQGLTNSVWTINCSTNLSPSNWFTLTNFGIPANPPVFTFVDLEATNLNRFYQVIPKVN